MSTENSHKYIANTDEQIIGYGENGKVITHNGSILVAKHERLRFRGNGLPRRNIYPSDTIPIPYSYDYVDYRETYLLVTHYLDLIKRGVRPHTNTTGIEIEGSFLNKEGQLQKDVFGEASKATQHTANLHPELMESTAEFVTGINNGSHLRGPLQVANGLGQAVLYGIILAESMNCSYVITSNPEVRGEQGNTNIPYLRQFAPIVKEDARQHIADIPKETRDMYANVGRPVELILQSDSDCLDWPNHGTHVHFGVAQHEDGNIDPRVALVAAHIRLSPFVKVLRSTLYSSRHFYGEEFDVKDTRSYTRRLIHTAHDTQLPNNYPEIVHDSIASVIKGDSPDISRYTGGHDRTRITPKKTNEDIGAPATPDLRAVLAFALSQEIINTIAIEALQYTHGDEAKAIEYLHDTYGGLLTAQPGIGEGSDHEWDVKFNESGYTNTEIRDDLVNTIILIERVGNEYPLLNISTRIINHILTRCSTTPTETDLSRRLGIGQDGNYDPQIPIVGLVSDHKKGMNPKTMAGIQHHASKKQAEVLIQIKTEEDLLRFYGLH